MIGPLQKKEEKKKTRMFVVKLTENIFFSIRMPRKSKMSIKNNNNLSFFYQIYRK